MATSPSIVIHQTPPMSEQTPKVMSAVTSGKMRQELSALESRDWDAIRTLRDAQVAEFDQMISVHNAAQQTLANAGDRTRKSDSRA